MSTDTPSPATPAPNTLDDDWPEGIEWQDAAEAGQ